MGAAGLVASSLLDPVVRRCVARRPVGGLAAAVLPRLRSLDRLRVPVRWAAPVERIATDARLARLLATDPNGGRCGDAPGLVPQLPGLGTRRGARGLRPLPGRPRAPAADRWTPVEASLRFLHRIPARHRRVVLLEGAGHLPVERGRRPLIRPARSTAEPVTGGTRSRPPALMLPLLCGPASSRARAGGRTRPPHGRGHRARGGGPPPAAPHRTAPQAR
ncbi:MAG: hypothetical protein AVDCRST_MAG66-4821 [uncultured Pseudonocardia sp.]|uniref:Uncharacterized protein n=1 Tax=uncultured Pseudonocardia sp. TaxID=211455 RepID=A0A6J4QNJ9_9PSEU|nr:MAG: hypothetical protein AVDCRST_MAG66-4821 [uncultured Pseudonocardia sp.]